MIDIKSLELERYLLSGVLRFPETFIDVDGKINENDFVNNLHKTIYGVIRQTLRNKEKIETVLIAQKINNLSLSFEDKVSNILDYLSDLKLIQIQAKGVPEIAEELRLFTIRRSLAESGARLIDEMRRCDKGSKEEIISLADKVINNDMSIWDASTLTPENICLDMPALLDHRMEFPVADIGLTSPYPILNSMYGAMLRPGNISVICSRSGAGKTTFLNDLCYKSSVMHKVPVLHFDNGEMLKEELQMRLAASLSGVPLYYIETGKLTRDMKEAITRIKPDLQNREFYYYNVAGKSVEEMLTILRRFYLSKIGRGNPMIFCFDYIKSTSERNEGNRQEFELIGKMVTKFKDFISSEVIVPMVSAVQANRTGVVTNRESSAIIDDESIFSGGDRTVFFASQAFILRKKTQDELSAENHKWGTHKLINVKARHLGQDVKRALSLHKLPSGALKANYLNFEISNFRVKEVGDLASQIQALSHMDITKKTQDAAI